VIGFTGHVGSWELTAAYIAARGIPIDVVARRMSNPLFDAYLNTSRTNAGMQVVYDADAVRRIPRSIREGRVVGLVADQGVLGLASTYVPFFGRPAKTPKGPAVFALRYKLPILFMAAMLQPSGKYRFRVEELPLIDTGDREADVDATVASFTNALERVVREYPEQYFWHHRRWKRQPMDTPPELRDPGAD
jgi:KDO2-lipid IV(A) lauroyltransferase